MRYTARKIIFSSSRRPENMVFPKWSYWNMIFLVLSGKIIFPFPENVILPLRRKMKDDLSQKNRRIYDIFFKRSEKKVFSKGPRWDMIFLLLSGKMVFFPENMIFFPCAESERRSFSRNTWNMIFSVYTCRCYKRDAMPLCPKKKSKMVLFREKHLKVNDVQDWYSRKSSRSLWKKFSVLSWRPLQAFPCIALQQKKPENLKYRIEVWLLLQFIRLDIFYNE